jgi:cation/acetate symporter
MHTLAALTQLLLSQAAVPAPAAPTTSSSLGSPTFASIGFFFLIVVVTLVITFFAAKKTKTSSEFYAAGRSVSALQNGFALAGDYMSAASFLGISGMVAMKGYDGMIYATGWLVGWPALMFLVAEPLRNLGKFTFADVVAFRLRNRPVRIAAAVGGILTVLFYTIAQMVGSGSLIALMFGLKYELAEIIVGVVMLAYVLFGGMLATTWVQIIKAVLLLCGVSVLTVLVLAKFGFHPGNLYAEVQSQYGATKPLEPGGLVANPIEAISLGLALMFGLLGLPHILMRFYTVPDAKAARKSVLYATGLIGYFYLIIPIVGFGAAVLVGRGVIDLPQFGGGGNMASPLLAELLGGTPFLGFIAAVAFATILAVVAGLTLAGASAYSHDIYVSVIKGGKATEEEQVKAAKLATVVFGVFAVGLGIVFKGQNVAFMVGLAFAIAASANFPALVMSIIWKRFTTNGAVWSIIVGAFTSTSMIVLSDTVWVKIFHFSHAIFPMKNPAIFSMSAAFAVGIIVSLLAPEQEAQDKFEDEKLRTYLGVGAE